MIPLRQAWILGAVLLVLSGTAGADRARVLEIYSWSTYVDPAAVEAFEAEFDARVNFSYFDSDEARDKEMTASGGTGFDVILVNGLQLARYVERGWLAPLDASNAPNLRHIEARWSGAFDGAATGYGAAYFWGSLGIAWRGDLYPDGFSSWRELLQPDPRLAGRILMTDYGRELVGLALKVDGHSVNTSDRSLIRKAGRMLALQRSYLRGYGYPSLDEKSSLVTGDIWVAPMYSGDVLALMEFDDRIEFRLPDEGGQLWVDYLTVSSASARKPLAAAFIDFLNRPGIAARNAEYVFYATPNAAARALTSSGYRADPVIHPSGERLRRSEFLAPLPARSVKSVNTVMSELRAD